MRQYDNDAKNLVTTKPDATGTVNRGEERPRKGSLPAKKTPTVITQGK